MEGAHLRWSVVQIGNGVDGMNDKINPTHLYKGKPVEFVSMTHTVNGKQYCTILMLNRHGVVQRQSVQVCRLTVLPSEFSDSVKG